MTTTLAKPLISSPDKLISIEEFLDWYPKDLGTYELHNGVIVEMSTTGSHEKISSFLIRKLWFQIETLVLPWLISQEVFIKPKDADKSGYKPDVIILDDQALNDEPMWSKRSTVTQGSTVRLVIEVVSNNWVVRLRSPTKDDYQMKLENYEKLGIPEYWIIDYLGLGGRRFIGHPKQPTISVYQLIEDEYMVQQFRGDQKIESVIFPELNLTAKQIFDRA